ncbi:hypothetical protein [Pseudoalteromonas sp. EB27]|nr:hypothetical protein [Pseudoalteromonas sp. EB27]
MFFEGLSYETIFYTWRKDTVAVLCELFFKKDQHSTIRQKKAAKKAAL